MTVQISAEADGTLRALVVLREARLYDPRIAEELSASGLAEVTGGYLKITETGRRAIRTEAVRIRRKAR